MKINLLSNLPLKLLSLILAFILWIYFATETQILKDVEIPLNIIVAPEKVLAGDPVSAITVRVRGTERAISRLANQSLYANVDLADSPNGEKFVQITPEENIRGLPSDLEILSLTPERIKVTIENRATKSIPVFPRVSGNPKDPFVYYGYEVYPPTVMIEGALSAVSDAERAITEVIEIERKSQSFRAVVDVIPEIQSVKIVNPRPVTVFIKIDKNIKTAFFEALPVVFPPMEYAIVPSHDIVSLTIEGPEPIVKKITRNGITVSVNTKGLKPSNSLYQLVPHFSFSALSEEEIGKISIHSWRPEIISVKINPRRTEP